MAKLGDHYLDRGHRTPVYLAELLKGGLVALADPDPIAMQQVTLTDAGAARYMQLCQQQHRALRVPAPRSGATQRRAGVDDPGPFGGTVLP